MKKNANKVLVILIIVSLIILGLSLIYKMKITNEIGGGIDELLKGIDNNKEIDDVTGWGILLKSSISLFLGIPYMIAYMICVLPKIVAIGGIVLGIIGRLFLLGKEEKWKYNVFRTFIVIYDVFMIIFSFMYISIFGLNNILLTIILVCILASIAYNFYILFIKKLDNAQ